MAKAIMIGGNGSDVKKSQFTIDEDVTTYNLGIDNSYDNIIIQLDSDILLPATIMFVYNKYFQFGLATNLTKTSGSISKTLIDKTDNGFTLSSLNDNYPIRSAKYAVFQWND